jgi:hypothetical protein
LLLPLQGKGKPAALLIQSNDANCASNNNDKIKTRTLLARGKIHATRASSIRPINVDNNAKGDNDEEEFSTSENELSQLSTLGNLVKCYWFFGTFHDEIEFPYIFCMKHCSEINESVQEFSQSRQI